MTDSEPTDRARALLVILGKLVAAYPNQAISADTVDVYAEDLADLPIDDLAAAALKHRLTSRFFPSIHELRQAAASIVLPALRSGAEAWGDVLQAIAEHGWYHPPGGATVLDANNYVWDFPDPLVGQIVASIGWRTVCLGGDDMVTRAHFIKSYEQARDRAWADVMLTPALLALQTSRRAEALAITGSVARRLSAPAQGPQPTQEQAGRHA